MSLTHRKEVHHFTITLDDRVDELKSLKVAAIVRVSKTVAGMTAGRETAAKALLGHWHHQLTEKVFQSTREYAWLKANKVEWSLFHTHYADIETGMVHLYIESNKHAAQFKLLFGANGQEAIAA